MSNVSHLLEIARKLNGWERLWIVVSAPIWIVAAICVFEYVTGADSYGLQYAVSLILGSLILLIMGHAISWLRQDSENRRD
jgi:hypothetical protein